MRIEKWIELLEGAECPDDRCEDGILAASQSVALRDAKRFLCTWCSDRAESLNELRMIRTLTDPAVKTRKLTRDEFDQVLYELCRIDEVDRVQEWQGRRQLLMQAMSKERGTTH